MKPYFNTIPKVNCSDVERDDINRLLKVAPAELLSPDTIKAIENGEPISILRCPQRACDRREQDPLIQKCYKGNVLMYLVPLTQREVINSHDNHWEYDETKFKKRFILDGLIPNRTEDGHSDPVGAKATSRKLFCEICEYLAGIDRRYVRIYLLKSEDKTNREIAETLHISEATVSRDLGNIRNLVSEFIETP